MNKALVNRPRTRRRPRPRLKGVSRPQCFRTFEGAPSLSCFDSPAVRISGTDSQKSSSCPLKSAVHKTRPDSRTRTTTSTSTIDERLVHHGLANEARSTETAPALVRGAP